MPSLETTVAPSIFFSYFAKMLNNFLVEAKMALPVLILVTFCSNFDVPQDDS